MSETLIALGSLVVAAALAIIQIVNWIRDNRSKRIKELLSGTSIDEKRDSIVVEAAERVVEMLQRTIVNQANDNESLRHRVRQLEDEVREMKKERE